MASAMGRVDALSHWVASDHFEELGRPEKLGHGGFGLLTVGNLRKPRWWALSLLDRLGDTRLETAAEGDGADGLVATIAARADDGEVGVLVWNSSLDQSRIPFDELLARDVSVTVRGLPTGRVEVRHWRVDEEHSNVYAAWRDMGGAHRAWPEGDEWDRLRDADRLAELEPPRTVEVGADGVLEVSFRLPQPGISYLAVTPA
jgi:xylan 1,4-beta-xylosidase